MAFGNEWRTVAPTVHPLELRDTLPPVERRVMDNGAELVTLCQGLQSVSRLSVIWPVGYADVENPAAMRILREMLGEGTNELSGMELAEAFEFNGAWVKVECARHMTAVTAYVLNSRAPHVLPLMAAMIASPAFPPEAFSRIRSKVAAACEVSRRKVLTRAGELIDALMYGDYSPLAHVVTPDEIAFTGREALLNLHSRLMGHTLPRVYLAGALAPELIRQVCSTIGNVPFDIDGTGISRRIVAAPAHVENVSRLYRDTQSMQTAFKLAIPVIGRKHPDYDTLRFTVMALGGHFSSRLMRNIREEKGYTYGISASMASLPEGTYAVVSCQCDNRYARAVEKETVNEINAMATKPLTADEFDAMRNTATTGMASLFDSPFNIMDYHQTADLFNLSAEAYTRQADTLRNLSRERLAECARKYLADAPRLTAMAGNPALHQSEGSGD